MAPDINSLPPSTSTERPISSSRHSTDLSSHDTRPQIMGPPSVPASATSHPQPRVTSSVDQGLPIRHPRPLTAAELYLECEKEQEAVVNRLTRELTALRAQSLSVASNASQSSNSTSASLLPVDISDPNPTHQITSATHPTPRRHRSSSSMSARSIPTPSTSVGSVHPHTQNTSNAHGVSQASMERAAARVPSRQPSISASETSTPARRSVDLSRHQMHTAPRPSLSRDTSFASQNTNSTTAQAGTPAPYRVPSPALNPGVPAAMQHFADATAYRSEMEIVKAENEALRQRVRALERALRSRRRDSSQSGAEMPPRIDPAQHRPSRDAISPSASMISSTPSVGAWAAGSGVGGVAGPRERSESQSTTASSRRGIPVDEEVRVGESAASLAVARGQQ